jgi:phage head maturation protease
MMSMTTPSSAPSAPNVNRGTPNMPVMNRAATLVPTTFNEADNTIDVVWTTGASVRRYDWWNDTPYDEELVVTPQACDMSRFEAGTVQVLDNHQVYGGVNSILGVATRGSIENGEGRATLRLSTRPEMAGIVNDIKAGVIRSISFGYRVNKYEITRAMDRTDGVNVPLYRAVAWQPNEISFVTVPADADASTRSAPQSGHPCEFITRAPAHQPEESSMSNQGTQPGAPTNAPIDANRAAAPATPAAAAAHAAAPLPDGDPAARAWLLEANRAADIAELCARHNAVNLAADLIRNNSTMDQARIAILEERARLDGTSGGNRNVRIETVSDEHQTRLNGITEAIMNRVNSRAELTDNGRQYRGMSLLEVGRDLLESCGVSTRGMDRLTLATRMLTFRSGGMMTTSDFANLFANVANKRLRNAYEENPGTYQMWARRAPNAPDFKNINVVQLSGAPDLLQTNEHGEFKYGSMTDGAENYKVLTFGRIVSLSRQSIINDDLRGFDRLVGAFGGSAARLENRMVYSQLTANAALADSLALFEANTHKNLGTGAGSALQFSALTTARAAMRVQKGLQGEELNLTPAYLIVPAALEQTAYQLTSSNYTPAKQADVNEFRTGGRTSLEPIVEPVLDANSATAWYLASNNGQVDTVEYCFLDGAEGPVIETDVGFEVDGLSYKCRLDFATKAIDYRGLYKAAGA